MEEWRDVPGYGGWYECSSEGRVRSWKKPGRNGSTGLERAPEPRVMSLSRTRGDYLMVGLSNGLTVRRFRVNRLVLLSFRGEPFDGAQACHHNGDRQDNRLSNLYWGTSAENQADKARHGTQVRGERSPTARLTRASVREIRALWSTGQHSVLGLAERYGVSGPTLWKAATGKTWKDE